MTKRVQVRLPAAKSSSYSIHIGAGIIQELPKWLARRAKTRKVVVISDRTVMKHCGPMLLKALKGHAPIVITIPAGERSKSHSIKHDIEHQMFKKGCGRDSIIIAFGGGVVGDLAGYVAATYMRGLPYIQVPTTLLAMVDSSVGGKTGIDTPFGKNLVGAFWQPQLVIADTHFLKTLPRAHIVNGLIEAIKMALTHSAKDFSYLLAHVDKAVAGNPVVLSRIIQRAVTTKAGVVGRDEKESSERMALNFGHTIGHAIEHLSDYRMMHGIAVALGILVEAQAAELLGLLNAQAVGVIEDLFAKLTITPQALKTFQIDKILRATQLDKKSKSGQARYVLLQDLGRVYKDMMAYAHPVSDAIVRKSYQLLTGA